MPQWQIVGPDGHPCLTLDGVTPLESGAIPVEGASAIIFDDGLWPDAGDAGFSDAAVREFVQKLGDGYTYNCMGRSPNAKSPAELEAHAARVAGLRQSIADQQLANQDRALYRMTIELRECNASFDAQVDEATSLGESDLIQEIEVLRTEAINQILGRYPGLPALE